MKNSQALEYIMGLISKFIQFKSSTQTEIPDRAAIVNSFTKRRTFTYKYPSTKEITKDLANNLVCMSSYGYEISFYKNKNKRAIKKALLASASDEDHKIIIREIFSSGGSNLNLISRLATDDSNLSVIKKMIEKQGITACWMGNSKSRDVNITKCHYSRTREKNGFYAEDLMKFVKV
jgi:hypothetical protein